MTIERRRRIAWIFILVVDAAYIAWGGMAAAAPDHLLGPHGLPILAAGYEGFSHASWRELANTSPMTAAVSPFPTTGNSSQ